MHQEVIFGVELWSENKKNTTHDLSSHGFTIYSYNVILYVHGLFIIIISILQQMIADAIITTGGRIL
jgi:hypothetical protein